MMWYKEFYKDMNSILGRSPSRLLINVLNLWISDNKGSAKNDNKIISHVTFWKKVWAKNFSYRSALIRVFNRN